MSQTPRPNPARMHTPRLLTPAEVAARFGVDAKTVARWAKARKISCIRTPGNHRRFPEDEIQAMIDGSRTERS